ncbi:transmembrane protein, putative (macronuclear) [Tetrahymena thermophila SB210]|uniref:Transmembrane protein, putative n=1 Tax=Tetrahymena thermophila (strain SB210) TaxID=312017 RepID=Q233P5_TETTS|nr:transmembrane protein, putative [Tetrahymena thermophila SB210]EAR91784.2 transmembrane protein, putative [Tetrahymena thermophila SB210]|eukprot:XP_001012029.2 transmembrane protein, putative [Tetrahymena thermophila SB210]
MLDQLDIFGSQIFLRFNKKQTYNTRLGSYFTLIIYLLIFYRLFGLIEDVIQRNNPEVIYNERQVDDPAIFQASSKSFPMAFAMEDPIDFNHFIDESIYTVTAFWNQKHLAFDDANQQYIYTWNQTSINVQPCTIENFQNLENQKYYLNLNYTNMYCLPPDFELPIQGDFTSLVYSEIQIMVKKCTKNCQSQEILDKFLQRSNFGLQLSDSYVDPTISDNPFKIYSRDMFWSTSTQLPKDVTVYIRNNYVYSDFGLLFTDVTTQRLPAYSFYESQDYPSSFQDYFLSIYFRFEKQKEGVYKRSYRKFSSILSEIGGFTQSFLAIGYIICKKISQTKLDIDLINKAFKFEGSLKSKQQNEENEANKSIIHQQQKQGNEKKLKKSNQSQEKKNSSKVIFSSSDENLRKTQQPSKNNIQSIIQKSQINEKGQKQILPQNPPKNSLICQDQKSDKFYCNLNEQDAVLEQNENKKGNQLKISQLLMSYIQDQSTQFKKSVGIPDNQEQQINNLQNKGFSEKEQEKSKKQVEDQFKKNFDNQMSSMQLSIWQYFKSAIFCYFSKLHKEQKNIINYSREKLYYNIDIFNIIHKLNELEKLKRLIFDQDQLKLFDYLPKPTIQTDISMKQNDKKEEIEIDLLYQDNRSELQKACESFQAYQNIAYKSDQSTLDQKLINQLDPVLKKMFKQLNEKSVVLKNSISQNEDNRITSFQNLTPSMRQSIINLSNQNFQNNQSKLGKDKNSFRLFLNPQISSKSNPTAFKLNQFEQQQFNDIKYQQSKQPDNQNQQFINQSSESQIQDDEFEEICQNNKKKKLNAFVSNMNQLSQL